MRRRWRAAVFGAIVVGTLLAPATLAQAQDTTDGDTSTITVTVTDGSSPKPSPSVSPSTSATPVPGPGSAGTGGSNGPRSAGTGANGGASGSGGGATTGGSGTDTGAKPGEVSVAGMVYVSGVSSSGAISPNPLEGVVTVWLTVRNASKSAIDAKVDFWMESLLFGVPLDSVGDVAVAGLQPGESRVVSAQLHGAGQWTLVNTHATLTPPDSVDGTALTPVTRDATVFVFPWLIVLLIALTLIAILVRRAIRAARAPAAATEVIA